jgi:hypothetical protein
LILNRGCGICHPPGIAGFTDNPVVVRENMLAVGDLGEVLLDPVSIFRHHQAQVVLALQVASGASGMHLHSTVDITYDPVQSNVDAGWRVGEKTVEEVPGLSGLR